MPVEEVTPESSFIGDLGYDSLDLVEFTMEIEEVFDVTVPDDIADGITTVGQAIDEVRKCLE